MLGLCIFFIPTYLGIHTITLDGKSGEWGKLQNLPTAGMTQNGSWLEGMLRESPALQHCVELLRQSLQILRNSENNHVHTWKPALGWPILCTLKPHHYHAFIIPLTKIFKLFCRNPTYPLSETLLGPLFSPEIPFFQPWDREAWDDSTSHGPRSKDKSQG